MDGCVFERKGHTEASVDLAKLCGVAPSAVICEIINEDGTMSRLPQLQELAEKFDLKLIHIEDLIKYKQKNESLVQREVETMLPMQNYGTFKVIGYSNQLDNNENIAVVNCDYDSNKLILHPIHF